MYAFSLVAVVIVVVTLAAIWHEVNSFVTTLSAR